MDAKETVDFLSTIQEHDLQRLVNVLPDPPSQAEELLKSERKPITLHEKRNQKPSLP